MRAVYAFFNFQLKKKIKEKKPLTYLNQVFKRLPDQMFCIAKNGPEQSVTSHNFVYNKF